MKPKLLLISLAAATPVFASNFGATSEPPKSTTKLQPAATTTSPPLATGPQVGGMFRIVKPDGATVIQQSAISVGTTGINVINVSAADAFLTSSGKCAFNVKYDEYTAAAASKTTNRLFDNDVLIAQNTAIDIAANVSKTIWTQPYLVPGQNNIKLVINADSSTPSIGWVRVNVSGNCSGASSTASGGSGTTTASGGDTESHTPAPPPTSTGGSTANKPASPPVTVAKFGPGTSQWNNLYTAFGYSNFGVTQLKGKSYARYADLVKLNADLSVFINAKIIDEVSFNTLMTRWNSFVTDPAFRAAMTSVVASTSVK